MENYTTTIGNKEVQFTDDYIQIDKLKLRYDKMSKIGYRSSGDEPGFVFNYGERRITIPCSPEEKEKMYPFFQKAVALERKRKAEEAVEPVGEPTAKTSQVQSPPSVQTSPPRVNKNMKICKFCGAEIAKSAKKCPHCGGKNKKPIYKRVWFIILCILVLLGILGSVFGGRDDSAPTPNDSGNTAVTEEQKTEKQKIEYTPYDVKELNKDLEKNAINAKEKYNDKYIELTGKLENIDSDGSYISLTDPDDELDLVGIMCYIKDDSQLDVVKKHSVGDTVTIKGKVTDVGEVIGYSVDIDEIK